MLPVAAAVWGPFPLRRARLAFGLLTLAMALLFILGGLQRHVVTCARSGALAEQCEWRTGLRDSSARRFPLSALRAVHVAYTETTSKGHTTRWGQLMLGIGGHDYGLVREKAEAADQHAAALQTFLREPTQREVRIDTGWQVGMLGMGGAFALVGIALLYMVWYERRRFYFSWDAGVQQLTMQTRLPLGMASSENATWNLRAPVNVEVQWEEVKDFFTSPRSPGPRGGRLLVRLADGRSVDLLPHPMPGYSVHLRGAEQLRRLLRCPPPPATDAERIAQSIAAEHPQLGPGWTGITGRIAATWLGACCGSLIGIAVCGGLAVLLGFVKLSDNADGPWFFGGALGGAAAGIALAWRIFLRPDVR